MKTIGLAALTFAILTGPCDAQSRVKTAYLACTSESLFDRAETIRRSGDTEAIKTYLTGAMASGLCIWMPVGTNIFYEGTGSRRGIAKIRPQGSIQSYFTNIQVIE